MQTLRLCAHIGMREEFDQSIGTAGADAIE
jgi:hypothetical protein